MPVPIIGPSYDLATPKADVQRTVNMFPVMNEVVGGKTGAYFQQVPGLDVFSEPALQNDLLVVKTQEVDSAVVGDTQTYSVIVTNFGPDAADGGTVTDDLPAAFTFTSCDIVYAGGADGPATATEAELAAGIVITPWPSGGTATLTIVGTFNAAGEIVNTATAALPVGNIGTGGTDSVTTSVTPHLIRGWNAATANGTTWVLSDADQTAFSPDPPSTGIPAMAGLRPHNSGKYYLELSWSSDHAYGSTVAQNIGLSFLDIISGFAVDPRVNGVAYNRAGGIYHAGALVTVGPQLLNGDVVPIAIDLTAGSAWVGHNADGWIGGGDPATGTTPTVTGIAAANFRPMICTESPASLLCTLFDYTPLTYTIPSGFTPWAED